MLTAGKSPVPPAAMDAARGGPIKANFDSVYLENDPREYYRVLYGLDYVIPQIAKPVFLAVIAELERLRGRPLRVLDIGCSYGNNAALLQFPLDLDRIAARYRELSAATVGLAELVVLDRAYFRSWPRRSIEFVGLDASRPAIDYARAVGLIHHGIAGDFEFAPLPPEADGILRGIDLVVSTGTVGYVTERTLSRVLEAIGQPAPWVASFVLRMFPYDRIAATLAGAGLRTEKLHGATFVQRRFQSAQECAQVLERLRGLGLDPTGKEAEGLFHAEFFLSRPLSDTAGRPLESIVSLTQGTDRPLGPRFASTPAGTIRLVR